MTSIISQIFVFLLTIDSAVVVAVLAKKKNAWKIIILYWILLTLKNAVDFIGMI